MKDSSVILEPIFTSLVLNICIQKTQKLPLFYKCSALRSNLMKEHPYNGCLRVVSGALMHQPKVI